MYGVLWVLYFDDGGLACFVAGNPLLDISAHVDQELLDKYKVSTRNFIIDLLCRDLRFAMDSS